MKTRRFKQKGFTLMEALASFAVTATGFLAVAGFQGDLFAESAHNKTRTEALSLAEQKIEQFRHYTFADETNYIDDNNDGSMDADGDYADPPIAGQNATFTRSWALSTTDQAKQIDVTVSWADSANVTQSVFLAASLPWISPRSGADQIATLALPSLDSPTGRAEIGEGELADYPNVNPVPVSGPGPEGLATYQNEENLLLVDNQNRVLLTLLDACNTATQQCTDFVKIAGTVYMDKTNASQILADTYLIASDAAHCQRWVESGTLSSPPTTASGNYEYFHYTCYLGGGWHGNVGITTAPDNLQQSDKVCQGDPTSSNAWEEPVIALRRAYRGMLSKTVNGQIVYESHGIRDAASFTGHDFVFTRLDASFTAGSYCEGLDAPMTRTDASGGRLFAGVPTDFVCLNDDPNNDGLPDYLDSYDTSVWSAGTTCPFDPTDPPVGHHTISGQIAILTAETLDLSRFSVVTSDGPGNCSWTAAPEAIAEGYVGTYGCTVYDWGNGWSGYIEVLPNSSQLYCPDSTSVYTDIRTDQSQSYVCISTNTVIIGGTVLLGDGVDPIGGISIYDSVTGEAGYCALIGSDYHCLAPYAGDAANLTLAVQSADYVCGSVDGGLLIYTGLTADGSPYQLDIVVSRNNGLCPIGYVQL